MTLKRNVVISQYTSAAKRTQLIPRTFFSSCRTAATPFHYHAAAPNAGVRPEAQHSSPLFPQAQHRPPYTPQRRTEPTGARPEVSYTVTPHPHPALLTCSVADPKRNPRHLTPPSSNTGQYAFDIFISVTGGSKTRSLSVVHDTFLSFRLVLKTAEGPKNLLGARTSPPPESMMHRRYLHVLTTRGRSWGVSSEPRKKSSSSSFSSSS